MIQMVSKLDAANAVTDRPRRIAFAISLIGLVCNCIIASAYAQNGGLTLFLAFNFTVQTLAIGSICLASYFNWHFRAVLNTALAVIYFHLWGTTYYDAWIQDAYLLSFIILLFIPFSMVLVAGYRALLACAAIQATLVYVYVQMFMANAFGLDPETVDFTQLATVLAIMSAFTLSVLAFVSYSRRELDHRLLSLVHETERMAEQDDLTGLKNRRSFMAKMQELWDPKDEFAVVFIEIDQIKP